MTSTSEPTGLSCGVYRASDLQAFGDSTNGGVSGRFNRVVLMRDPNEIDERVPVIDAPFAAREDMPALYLKPGHIDGWRAVPANDPPEGCTPWMFGGNFIYSSDSRFPSHQPIAVHDRTETREQYNRMCD